MELAKFSLVRSTTEAWTAAQARRSARAMRMVLAFMAATKRMTRQRCGRRRAKKGRRSRGEGSSRDVAP